MAWLATQRHGAVALCSWLLSKMTRQAFRKIRAEATAAASVTARCSRWWCAECRSFIVTSCAQVLGLECGSMDMALALPPSVRWLLLCDSMDITVDQLHPQLEVGFISSSVLV